SFLSSLSGGDADLFGVVRVDGCSYPGGVDAERCWERGEIAGGDVPDGVDLLGGRRKLRPPEPRRGLHGCQLRGDQFLLRTCDTEQLRVLPDRIRKGSPGGLIE